MRRPSPDRRRKVEELAERLGNGECLGSAAVEMGITSSACRGYFKTICDELGDQSIGKWRLPWPQ